MARVSVTPDDIRKAAKFLTGRGLAGKIAPSLLARSAAELGKSFEEILRTIGEMLDEGQGRGPAPKAKEMALNGR